MDSRLKQRLIGAAVLVALAVIFLPMLVQGPAPDSGVSDVPLSMPDTPRGDYETRDLPLVTPGDAPDGGAVGMQSTPQATPATTAPGSPDATPAPADTVASSSQPIPLGGDASANTEALPQAEPGVDARLPAVTAAGDYAVSFGTYSTPSAADAVIASLRASQLPARREPTTANGKPAWRVRIGPYASRADAEIARLRATHVRDDADARVVVLDAALPSPTPQSPSSAKTADTSPPAVAPKPAPAQPTAASSTAASAATGFAVQLAAYSKPGEATALRDRLRAAGFTAFTESVDTDKGTLTRVRVGPVITRAEADQLRAQVRAKVGLDGVVRPHP
jgi:cell division septation protein DedD